MALRHVSRIEGLEPWQVQLLQSHNLGTARDVLLSSTMDLMELLGLSEAQARAIVLAVSQAVSPAYRTVGVQLLHAFAV
jgi:hypothetical protein